MGSRGGVEVVGGGKVRCGGGGWAMGVALPWAPGAR